MKAQRQAEQARLSLIAKENAKEMSQVMSDGLIHFKNGTRMDPVSRTWVDGAN